MSAPIGRPRVHRDRISTNVRVERELWARVSIAAEERDVSVNWLVCRLISEGLDALVPVDEMLLTRKGDT